MNICYSLFKKNDSNGFGLLPVIIAVLLTGLICTSGWLIHKSGHASNKPLMTVTSSGGNCFNACNFHHNSLYNDGYFEDHKKLSSSEVATLKNIIKNTDFTKYGPNPHPQCSSFSDGSDETLLFPQKYGEETFTPCMLNIPTNDTAYAYIDNLLQTHYVQNN